MEDNFRIYIDNIVFNFQKIGGISVYLSEVITRLLHSGLDVSYIEQSKVLNNTLRKTLSIPHEKIIVENSLPVRLISYLPIRIHQNNNALVHSSYYRICSASNIANIVTVYDFNYELGYVRRGIRKYLHCHQKKSAVEKADGVICISVSTKRDLLQRYKNINPDKVTVIHLAAGDEFYKIGMEHDKDINKSRFAEVIGKKYILFVGSRDFHKNFNICVETLFKLSSYHLIIVGSSLTADETKMLDAKLPLRYHAFNNVSAADLNMLYNYAFCFMYPSSYEGFGIPILESMQAGCPVVTTNISSIPEVCGDAALMVDKVTSEEFINKIISLEQNSFRRQIINAGFDQALKFSWDKTYRETVDFYRQVFRKKFNHSPEQ